VLKSTTAIYDLLESEHDSRMMHRVPSAPVVVRHEYIRDACKGRTVLDVGGSGKLQEIIKSVAKSYTAVDKESDDYCVDLDKEKIPVVHGIELIVCGEVVEHLSNPGFFLDGLREYQVPIIFTVPNAFCSFGAKWVLKGIENVNQDHVAYYSYHTFKVLLTRHGFIIDKFMWYNGQPGIAEGLVFLAR
jgi:hypothetical protein